MNSLGIPPRCIAAWVLLCSGMGMIGWILSFLHCLNKFGYAIALPILFIVIFYLDHKRAEKKYAVYTFTRKSVRRIRRLLPAGYFILAILALLGGILHAPNNYDAMAYRIPRVLNWLAEEQWHWIPTMFHRLNTRTCAIEWVTAPLILFTGSDRFLFLPSIISFFLMPGLSFSLLTRLRVSPKVAWQWMWLLPSGYCYVLQAGGIGNDLFGTILALCAIDLALRAWKTNRVDCTLLSLLAAAAMTAVKTNNITLGLAWAILISRPLWRSLRRRVGLTLFTGMVAMLCSLVPTAVLNQIHCKDWSGARAERLETLTQGDPIFRITHNLALTVFQNVAPPFFPFGGNQCSEIIKKALPDEYQRKAATLFESSSADWRFPEMQMEESASVGAGILFLMFLGAICSFRSGTSLIESSAIANIPKILAVLFVSSVMIGFLVFCSRSGFVAVGRYFGLYFPFLLPAALWMSGFRRVLSMWIWTPACVVVMAVSALLLVVTPSRPLFPVEALTTTLRSNRTMVSNPLFLRMESVYSTYSDRSEAFLPLAQRFSGEKNVGIYTFDDPEASLWKPFGSRRVLHILPNDTRETLRERGIHVGAIKVDAFGEDNDAAWKKWYSTTGAEPVARVSLKLRARVGSVDWIVVKFH